MQRGIPVAPEWPGRILKRILANRVRACAGDPPDRVLNQILRQLRVVLIQIREFARKPPIEHAASQCRACIRIRQRPRLKIQSGVVRARALKPTIAGRIISETIFIELPEMLFDGVIIGRVIPVVARHLLAAITIGRVGTIDVVADWREP